MDFDLQKILSGLMLVGGAIAWYVDYRERQRKAAQDARDALRVDYDRIYAERNQLRDRNAQLEQERSELKQTIEQLQGELARLKRESAELEAKEAHHGAHRTKPES